MFHCSFMKLLGVFCFLFLCSRAWAGPSAVSREVPAETADASDISTAGAQKPKLMDGVELEAVESYINPATHQVGLGVGLYPFDAYFYGMSLSAGYVYHASRNLAWEVLNAQFFTTFQKDLTTELADRYSVSPKAIDALRFLFSSDLQYTFAYGKVAMIEEYIRYFRCSAMLGLGAVSTSIDGSSIAGLLGLKLEAFTGGSFSWTFEIRDSISVPDMRNYMTFTLGTGIGF
jgi:hypothetical protein